MSFYHEGNFPHFGGPGPFPYPGNEWRPRPGPRPRFAYRPPGRYSSPAFPDGVPYRPPFRPPYAGPRGFRPPPPPPPMRPPNRFPPVFPPPPPQTSPYPGKGGFNQQEHQQVTPENATGEELKALAELIQPLYCKLCTVSLSSSAQADDHLKGKNHKAKTAFFLSDLRRKKLAGENININDGHKDGTDYSVDTFGNGTGGGQIANKITGPNPAIKRQKKFGANTNKAKKPKSAGASLCQTCNVSVTSETEMATHVAGAKHRKKVEMLQQQGGQLVDNGAVSVVTSTNLFPLSAADQLN